MGKCDFCKTAPYANAVYGLTHDHFKVCNSCYLKQRVKGLRGRAVRCERTSMEGVWCFFCHGITGPDEMLYGRFACNECMTRGVRTPWNDLPKVGAEWVDPKPLAQLPNAPPFVVHMKATQENMAASVADTIAAETLAAMMDQGGRRRHSRAENRRFRQQFKK